ncbi:MAG: hypothetical protein JW803_06515 [Endomicrobiales bacterium]|nr:hypothetical protein [Endomicrobiales bacterium]
MKKLLFIMAFVVLAAGSMSSLFAFTTVTRSTYTAGVTLTAGGTVYVNLAVRHLSDELTTCTSIWWDPSQIIVGSTEWRRADAMMIMWSTVTIAGSGIQIYTDNMAADATPQINITHVSSTNPAGLIALNDSSYTPLPMCWRVVDVSTDSLTIEQQTGSPYSLFSTELGGESGGYPCFIYMKDRADQSVPTKNVDPFTDGMDYVCIKQAGNGIQHAADTFGSASSPDYIYFGAKFTDALAGETYRTTTMRIERYTQ